MPYIKQEDRIELYKLIGAYMENIGAENAGELNYLFTMISNKYFREHGQNYKAVNDIIGALEGAKLEFYRRTAIPYEDQKIIENGDVTWKAVFMKENL